MGDNHKSEPLNKQEVGVKEQEEEEKEKDEEDEEEHLGDI